MTVGSRQELALPRRGRFQRPHLASNLNVRMSPMDRLQLLGSGNRLADMLRVAVARESTAYCPAWLPALKTQFGHELSFMTGSFPASCFVL
jgi:hypothetical protein